MKFLYVVKNAQGKTITDIVEAFDESNLVDKLQHEGYFVLSVEELKTSDHVQRNKKEKKFTHGKTKLNDILPRRNPGTLKAEVRPIQLNRTLIDIRLPAIIKIIIPYEKFSGLKICSQF